MKQSDLTACKRVKKMFYGGCRWFFFNVFSSLQGLFKAGKYFGLYFLFLIFFCERLCVSFYPSIKYQTTSAMVYLYKSLIRPRIEHYSHKCARVANPHHPTIQKHVSCLLGDEILPCNLCLTDETLSAFHYSIANYYDRCSDEIHSFVPPAHAFTARTLHAIFTEAD